MTIWDNGFEEPEVTFPDKIVADLIAAFEKATGGFANLSLRELVHSSKLGSRFNTAFQFKIVLLSDIIDGYSFEVFRFGYDVTIYPVNVIIEEGIGDELDLQIEELTKYGLRVFCYDEEEFRTLISNAFSTKIFRKTVGGLMKIARSRK